MDDRAAVAAEIKMPVRQHEVFFSEYGAAFSFSPVKGKITAVYRIAFRENHEIGQGVFQLADIALPGKSVCLLQKTRFYKFNIFSIFSSFYNFTS